MYHIKTLLMGFIVLILLILFFVYIKYTFIITIVTATAIILSYALGELVRAVIESIKEYNK